MEVKTKTVHGQLGLVLLIDKQTRDRARRISTEFKAGNSLDIGGQHTPHITLYHSKLENVPMKKVDKLLTGLMATLPIALSFDSIASFGGKFLFWDTACSRNLIRTHKKALALSEYFAPAGIQQADKEKITLSQEEEANVRKYGHPLVGALWRPHITIGYYPSGLSTKYREEKFEGRAIGVAFVRVGEAGSIAEILEKRILSE